MTCKLAAQDHSKWSNVEGSAAPGSPSRTPSAPSSPPARCHQEALLISRGVCNIFCAHKKSQKNSVYETRLKDLLFHIFIKKLRKNHTSKISAMDAKCGEAKNVNISLHFTMCFWCSIVHNEGLETKMLIFYSNYYVFCNRPWSPYMLQTENIDFSFVIWSIFWELYDLY